MNLATNEQYAAAVNGYENHLEEFESQAVSLVLSFNAAGSLIAAARYRAGGETTKWAETGEDLQS